MTTAQTSTQTSRQAGRVAGRVAIVTGAGSRGDGIGNGRAIAILLAREGAKVVVLDNQPQWLDVTCQMIADEGGQVRPIACDVTSSDACARAVQSTVDTFGGLDILVNNVGISGPSGSAPDTDADAWDAAIRVNVTSMMLTAKHAVPRMVERGGGSIVNMSSAAALLAGNPNLFYATTKAAVLGMTRAMAAQHGDQGIRVNAIAPGMVYTPMVTSKGMSDETRERRRRRSMLKTEGTAWDVAHAVLYLASDDARWVTGIVLPVDAGASAGRAVSDHPSLPSAR